jgi:hypothetical protein
MCASHSLSLKSVVAAALLLLARPFFSVSHLLLLLLAQYLFSLLLRSTPPLPMIASSLSSLWWVLATSTLRLPAARCPRRLLLLAHRRSSPSVLVFAAQIEHLRRFARLRRGGPEQQPKHFLSTPELQLHLRASIMLRVCCCLLLHYSMLLPLSATIPAAVHPSCMMCVSHVGRGLRLSL